MEGDSDREEDILHTWLGELDTLKRGLTLRGSQMGHPPPSAMENEPTAVEMRGGDTNRRSEYRCSLINIETTQEEELDAILGELNELEIQFNREITTKLPTAREEDAAGQPRGGGSGGGGRNCSPDTDSAFCDNLSVLSSCSATSSTDKKSSGVSSSGSADEDAARLKAEKIKIAIEKIKEASVKKLFIKVFTSDGSAKSLLVDEKMSVGQVTRILAEKNHVSLDPKWALVELVPDLYMERVYEDHEQLVENCLLWKVDSKNTLWFIERPEKFDLFQRPEVYLLGTSSSQRDDQMEEHSRQELLEEYFSSSGVGAPEVEGNIWLKADSKKTWKKFYFILRSSGLYYAPKGKKTSKDLVCLTTFDVNQVYYGVGWKNKYKAPTEFCFGIKHPQIQAKNPKYIKYLCVETQRELHQWVTGVRIAKNGTNLFDNYRGIVEEITHADIDILTSKRFSVNSTNGLQIPSADKAAGNSGIQSPARTPSSENKSLASALSSGIESDMSTSSSTRPDKITTIAEINESAATEESSERVTAGLTPVGTLDRSFKLRRSFSRSSRSSSSSGCLSDKSGIELGFESDFPVGGTIKKRPAATPRLPLTNTTWGLVRESDQEDEGDGGGVVGLGAGGTLLRKAVRNSLSRKPQDNDPIYSGIQREASLDSPPPPVRQTEVPVEDALSSAFERSLSGFSEDENLPLPPPPRVDSISSLIDDIDQLPPPPPDMCYEQLGNHYHASPVSSPTGQRSFVQESLYSTAGLPPMCPVNKLPTSPKPAMGSSTPKKSSSVPHKSSRRISFDDNVQMIEASSSPVKSQTRPSPHPAVPPPNPPSVLKFTPTPPIRHSPGRLTFGEKEAENTNSLPRSFLTDLQKVMNKKWQVAEKCKVEVTATPHEVLGFRDEPVHQVGQPGLYSQNSAIGAWVLESQQYTQDDPVVGVQEQYAAASEYMPYTQTLPHNHQYAASQPHHHHHHHHHGPHHPGPMHNGSPMHNGAHHGYPPHHGVPHGANGYPPSGPCPNGHQIYGSIPSDHYESYQQQQRPVVLREPEPNYVDPSHMRANKSNNRPPPPAPPRRSQNTQLTAGY